MLSYGALEACYGPGGGVEIWGSGDLEARCKHRDMEVYDVRRSGPQEARCSITDVEVWTCGNVAGALAGLLAK